MNDPRVARIVALFEQLSPEGLSKIGEVYTAGARFNDPFNEVEGVSAIRRVFEHMYATLDGDRKSVV